MITARIHWGLVALSSLLLIAHPGVATETSPPELSAYLTFEDGQSQRFRIRVSRGKAKAEEDKAPNVAPSFSDDERARAEKQLRDRLITLLPQTRCASKDGDERTRCLDRLVRSTALRGDQTMAFVSAPVGALEEAGSGEAALLDFERNSITVLPEVGAEGVVTWSPDGRYVAFKFSAKFNPRDCELGVYDTLQRRRVGTLCVPTKGRVVATSWAPGGQQIGVLAGEYAKVPHPINPLLSGESRYMGKNKLTACIVNFDGHTLRAESCAALGSFSDYKTAGIEWRFPAPPPARFP